MMRKAFLAVAAAAVTLTVFAGGVSAQTATATATYEVKAINEVSTSGNPAALVIDAASELDGVTDATTTWSITTNETNKKVTGAIDTDMPTGVTLKVLLAAPAGASSTEGTLSTSAVDLVTGIGEVSASGLGITYTLSAVPTAGVVTSASKTVTFTITAGI